MKITQNDSDYVQELNIEVTNDDIGFSYIFIDYYIYCVNPLVELSNNKGKNTAKLYINNELSLSKIGDMDFTDGKKIYVGSCTKKIYSDESKIVEIKTNWNFNKSQINEVPLVYNLIVPKVVLSKPIINFEVEPAGNDSFNVIYSVQNDYTRLDYKLNDNPWVTTDKNPIVLNNVNEENYLALRAYNENNGLIGVSQTKYFMNRR